MKLCYHDNQKLKKGRTLACISTDIAETLIDDRCIFPLAIQNGRGAKTEQRKADKEKEAAERDPE